MDVNEIRCKGRIRAQKTPRLCGENAYNELTFPEKTRTIALNKPQLLNLDRISEALPWQTDTEEDAASAFA